MPFCDCCSNWAMTTFFGVYENVAFFMCKDCYCITFGEEPTVEDIAESEYDIDQTTIDVWNKQFEEYRKEFKNSRKIKAEPKPEPQLMVINLKDKEVKEESLNANNRRNKRNS